MITEELRNRNRISKQRSRENPEIKEREKLYHERNRDREYARNKKRRQTSEGWFVFALANIRFRAKARGLEYAIEIGDLEIPSHCPVLGIPILFGSGLNGRKIPNSPSIDRIDNKKGYTKENVRLISLRANQLKSDATLEELKAIVRYMEDMSSQ